MDKKEYVYPTGFRYKVFQAAVLSLSLILASVNVAACLLGDLSQEFPEASMVKLQMFVSFPTIGGIIANLVGGQLAGKMGKKNLCMLGIALAAAGGFAPFFMPTLELKIAVRVIAAFGVGMVQPLSAALILDCFEGKVANTMMGIQSSMVGAGGTLYGATMAAIMAKDWHYAYFAYLYGFAVLLLVIFGIPAFVNEFGRTKKGEGNEAKVREKLPYNTYLAAICGFLYNLGFGALSACLSLAALETGKITTVQAAAIATVGGLAAMIGGFIFGLIKNRIGFNIGWIALALNVIGLFIVGTTSSVSMWYVGVCITQLGFCWWMPYSNFLAMDGTSEATSARATALCFAGGSLGSFIFPYVFAFVSSLAGGLTQHQGFIYGAIIVAVVTVIVAINHFKHIEHYKEAGRV